MAPKKRSTRASATQTSSASARQPSSRVLPSRTAKKRAQSVSIDDEEDQESNELPAKRGSRARRLAREQTSTAAPVPEHPRHDRGSDRETQDVIRVAIPSTRVSVTSSIHHAPEANVDRDTHEVSAPGHASGYEEARETHETPPPRLSGVTAYDPSPAPLNSAVSPTQTSSNMIDGLAELWDVSCKLVHLLAPPHSSPKQLESMTKELQDPNSRRSRVRTKLSGELAGLLDAYFGRARHLNVTTMSRDIIRRAGVREDLLSSVSEVRADEILYMANLAILADQALPLNGNANSLHSIDFLNQNFPQLYLSGFRAQPSSEVGTSDLLQKTLMLALMIRIEYFRTIVIAQRAQEDFLVSDAFQEVFYKGIDDGFVLKGWDSLPEMKYQTLNKPMQQALIAQLGMLESSIAHEDGPDVVLALLDEKYPSDLIAQMGAEWMALRCEELEMAFGSRFDNVIDLQQALDDLPDRLANLDKTSSGPSPGKSLTDLKLSDGRRAAVAPQVAADQNSKGNRAFLKHLRERRQRQGRSTQEAQVEEEERRESGTATADSGAKTSPAQNAEQNTEMNRTSRKRKKQVVPETDESDISDADTIFVGPQKSRRAIKAKSAIARKEITQTSPRPRAYNATQSGAVKETWNGSGDNVDDDYQPSRNEDEADAQTQNRADGENNGERGEVSTRKTARKNAGAQTGNHDENDEPEDEDDSEEEAFQNDDRGKTAARAPRVNLSTVDDELSSLDRRRLQEDRASTDSLPDPNGESREEKVAGSTLQATKKISFRRFLRKRKLKDDKKAIYDEIKEKKKAFRQDKNNGPHTRHVFSPEEDEGLLAGLRRCNGMYGKFKLLVDYDILISDTPDQRVFNDRDNVSLKDRARYLRYNALAARQEVPKELEDIPLRRMDWDKLEEKGIDVADLRPPK